jgi:hypothetical protein
MLSGSAPSITDPTVARHRPIPTTCNGDTRLAAAWGEAGQQWPSHGRLRLTIQAVLRDVGKNLNILLDGLPWIILQSSLLTVNGGPAVTLLLRRAIPGAPVKDSSRRGSGTLLRAMADARSTTPTTHHNSRRWSRRDTTVLSWRHKYPGVELWLSGIWIGRRRREERAMPWGPRARAFNPRAWRSATRSSWRRSQMPLIHLGGRKNAVKVGPTWKWELARSREGAGVWVPADRGTAAHKRETRRAARNWRAGPTCRRAMEW